MDVRNIEGTVQTRISGAPMYGAAAVASVSKQATGGGWTRTFSAVVIRVEAPYTEAYAVWYKSELDSKLYADIDTAIARAKRLINADVKAVREGRPAPK